MVHKRVLGRRRLIAAITGCAVIAFIAPVNTNALDQRDGARILGRALELHMTDDATDLYGLFPNIIPGQYDGRRDRPFTNRPFTLEQLTVALVRYAGWSTTDAPTRDLLAVMRFVSPLGIPYYAPDPTPRSAPYVVTALQHRLLARSDLPRLRLPVSPGEIRARARLVRRQTAPPSAAAPVRPLSQTTSIVLQPNARYSELRASKKTIVDLSTPSIRIGRGNTPMLDGREHSFPLGPLESALDVGIGVGEENYSHQAQAIYGRLDNWSRTVNGVGLWGEAVSHRQNSRVWGAFLRSQTVALPSDSQAIGLEIDVENNGAAGVAPNASKVGLQIVGLGRAPVTNGIELLAGPRSPWTNGINVQPDAITSDGAIIASAPGGRKIDRGIDLRRSIFRSFAIGIGTGQVISLDSKSGSPAEIYTDETNDGFLVLRAGRAGVRITSNDDSQNLLVLDAQNGGLTIRGRNVGDSNARFERILSVCAFGLAAVSMAYCLRLRSAIARDRAQGQA
jgi:hypothetical protein